MVNALGYAVFHHVGEIMLPFDSLTHLEHTAYGTCLWYLVHPAICGWTTEAKVHGPGLFVKFLKII